jgi:hypothetical protein
VFYLAAACWKAAAAAFVSVAVFVVAAIKVGFQPNMDEFAAVMIVLLTGVILNTILGIGATWAALTCKVRVWVHPRLHAMTRGDLRLATTLGPFASGFNHAIFVVATALVFPVIFAGAAGVAIMTVGRNANQLETLPVIVCEFVAFFGGPIAAIPAYVWLSSRIIARSPRECWHETTFSP